MARAQGGLLQLPSFPEILQEYINQDSERLDKLYIEHQMVGNALTQLRETDFSNYSIPDKWVTVLKNDNIVELRVLVTALLSIFPSNTTVIQQYNCYYLYNNTYYTTIQQLLSDRLLFREFAS